MKGTRVQQEPEPELANIEPDDLSTNQGATVVPWIAGEVKLPLRWISPVYDQKAVQAPLERPGKK